jgi:hypothetical protein
MPIELNTGFFRLLNEVDFIGGSTIIIVSNNHIFLNKYDQCVRIGENGDFENLREYDILCNRKKKKEFKNQTMLIDNTEHKHGDFISRLNPDYIIIMGFTEPLQNSKYNITFRYNFKLIHCNKTECDVYIYFYTKKCFPFCADEKKATVLLY